MRIRTLAAMAEEGDLGAMAREIIDANLYMTLATADSEGRPWASPVYPAEKMRPPAAHRLYRATATGHFVLDPAGHPDGSAGDHRAPVDL